jgi:hypothetical protein
MRELSPALAARRFALHENRREPFGAAVQSTSQTRGACANHDDVMEFSAGRAHQAKAIGDLE